MLMIKENTDVYPNDTTVDEFFMKFYFIICWEVSAELLIEFMFKNFE